MKRVNLGIKFCSLLVLPTVVLAALPASANFGFGQNSFTLGNYFGNTNNPAATDFSGIDTSGLGRFVGTGGLGYLNETLGLKMDLSGLDTPFGQAVMNQLGKPVTGGSALDFFTATKSGADFAKQNPEMFSIAFLLLNGDKPFDPSSSQTVQDYRRSLRSHYASGIGSGAINREGLEQSIRNAQKVTAAVQQNASLAAASTESTKQSIDGLRAMVKNSTAVEAQNNADLSMLKTSIASQVDLSKTILETEQERKQAEAIAKLDRNNQLRRSSGATFSLVNWLATAGTKPRDASEMLPSQDTQRNQQ